MSQDGSFGRSRVTFGHSKCEILPLTDLVSHIPMTDPDPYATYGNIDHQQKPQFCQHIYHTYGSYGMCFIAESPIFLSVFEFIKDPGKHGKPCSSAFSCQLKTSFFFAQLGKIPFQFKDPHDIPEEILQRLIGRLCHGFRGFQPHNANPQVEPPAKRQRTAADLEQQPLGCGPCTPVG